MAAERRAVDAVKPIKARVKDGAGCSRAGVTAVPFASSMEEKPHACGERRNNPKQGRQEIAIHDGGIHGRWLP